MNSPRISASSYSNTAPLIWSFLYGSNHGKVEIILDNAPARSAKLLMQDRVDAALVPVIASQFIDGVRLVPEVCVGARKRVRSVCLVTKGEDLENVKSVSLDVSSRTSVVLTKIVFREFLGFEPEWKDSLPDIDAMLAESDAALLIGDPALALSEPGATESTLRTFDLAELWRSHTGLGFVFAMWMTRQETCAIDFAAARDEGIAHLDEIVSNYAPEIGLSRDEMMKYLSQNISYKVDDAMLRGLELYLQLSEKQKLIDKYRKLSYVA
jgi:chorismate dehydratase